MAIPHSKQKKGKWTWQVGECK